MQPSTGRRPPPPFRRVTVLRSEALSPRMTRITLTGPELVGLTVQQPAASVRVLLPSAGKREVVLPGWAGNEFLLPDGRRPTIRTLTPRRLDPRKRELEVDVVIHDGGVASEWARTAQPGDQSAVSGPARGYRVDHDAPDFFLGGDETAMPAISQLLECLPAGKPVHAEIEIAGPSARTALLPERPDATVKWLNLPPGATPGEALVAAVQTADLGAETRIWIAGEAAAVQRVRRHLFEDRGVPRARASVRGYWKHGRSGGGDDD